MPDSTTNPQLQSMIDAVSQLGILMLLLLTGTETGLRRKAPQFAIHLRLRVCAPNLCI